MQMKMLTIKQQLRRKNLINYSNNNNNNNSHWKNIKKIQSGLFIYNDFFLILLNKYNIFL